MLSSVRHPAVAGRFYPGKPEALRQELRSYIVPSETKLRAVGCVSPHAGYMYSGHVAGSVYSSLELPKRFIILCPNHTGMGEPLAMMSRGSWLTPLGEVPVDTTLAEALLTDLPLIREDECAHAAEHAIEVQLPFLQLLVPDLTFVPIAVGTGRFPALEALGSAIASVVSASGDRVLVIASSDMNHYESDQVTRIKDARAIERILALDPPGLHEVVISQNISMCGMGPTVAMLTAALTLGAKQAQLIRYATSADVSGDRDYCVGYAGIVVS